MERLKILLQLLITRVIHRLLIDTLSSTEVC